MVSPQSYNLYLSVENFINIPRQPHVTPSLNKSRINFSVTAEGSISFVTIDGMGQQGGVEVVMRMEEVGQGGIGIPVGGTAPDAPPAPSANAPPTPLAQLDPAQYQLGEG